MSFKFKHGLVLILIICHPLLFNFSCKSVPFHRVGPGFIIGTDNIVSVKDSWNDIGIRKVVRATVLIATNTNQDEKVLCSGTLIKPKQNALNYQVITNHHCFHKKDQAGQVTTQLLDGACTNTWIYVGFNEIESKRVRNFACMPGSLKYNLVGDLATFEVAPESFLNDIALELNFAEPKIDEELLVVHYPMLEKRFSVMSGSDFKFPQASLTKDDCKNVGPFSLIEKQQDSTLTFAFQHSCDLEFGSSGSAIWSKDGSLFYGVNWGGIEIKSKQSIRRINSATSAKFVEAFLNGNDENYIKQSGVVINNQSPSSSDVTSSPTSRESSTKTKPKDGFCGVVRL